MSIVQSVIISKDHYTLAEAKKWIKIHGYKEEFKGKKVHETDKYYRFRQADPKPGNYITKQANEGVKLVIEYLHHK